MAEDVEVENGISSTIRSVKDLPSDITEDVEVGGNGDGGGNKTGQKITSFQKVKRTYRVACFSML